MLDSVAGVVLAAGVGSRLRPLSDEVPKALCPVGNVPLLDLAAARLRELGCASLAANVWARPLQIIEHVAGSSMTQDQPVVDHLSVEDELLGTAGGLAGLRNW